MGTLHNLPVAWRLCPTLGSRCHRLQRAERLLPLPLAGHGLDVGVALEIAQWLGTQAGTATRDR